MLQITFFYISPLGTDIALKMKLVVTGQLGQFKTSLVSNKLRPLTMNNVKTRQANLSLVWGVVDKYRWG